MLAEKGRSVTFGGLVPLRLGHDGTPGFVDLGANDLNDMKE